MFVFSVHYYESPIVVAQASVSVRSDEMFEGFVDDVTKGVNIFLRLIALDCVERFPQEDDHISRRERDCIGTTTRCGYLP